MSLSRLVLFCLNHINNLQDIVEREWAKICLQRTFNHDFQLSVMEPCYTQTLLKLFTMTKDKEEGGEYETLN
jgi:hypothetical protein